MGFLLKVFKKSLNECLFPLNCSSAILIILHDLIELFIKRNVNDLTDLCITTLSHILLNDILKSLQVQLLKKIRGTYPNSKCFSM